MRRLYGRDQLHDLRDDPAELCNRIDDLAYDDVFAAMRDRLLTHLLETTDIVPMQTDRWA